MSRFGLYEIEEELGRGAMGIVFRAYDPTIRRRVALKVIHPQSLASEGEIAAARVRFFREAAAAGKLSHPNIVTLYHMGEEQGFLYLVMEYVIGASIEKLLQVGAMGAAGAVGLLKQVADALDHAHNEGIIHRDVKPANVLVRPDGRAKLTDFGIAHIQSQTITKTGMTMGTPSYMAPEQILAARLDGKSDQFSLGSSAYEMLAGRKPFEASSVADLMVKIVNQEPPSIHSANAALPESCSSVLSKALAKKPEARYANCTEFVAALARCFEPRGSDSGGEVSAKNLDKSQVRCLLSQLRNGKAAAADQLFEILKGDLERLAARYVKAESSDQTVQPAMLAKEAYFKVFPKEGIDRQDRAHFLAFVARHARHLLLDRIRQNRSEEPGASDVNAVVFHFDGLDRPGLDLEQLNEGLTELQRLCPGAAQVVGLKLLGGLTEKQIAEVLGITYHQVRRDREFAGAWLFHRLKI